MTEQRIGDYGVHLYKSEVSFCATVYFYGRRSYFGDPITLTRIFGSEAEAFNWASRQIEAHKIQMKNLKKAASE